MNVELGPYRMKYTSNGRYMLLGGRKGHLGLLDMLSFDIVKEFQVIYLFIFFEFG